MNIYIILYLNRRIYINENIKNNLEYIKILEYIYNNYRINQNATRLILTYFSLYFCFLNIFTFLVNYILYTPSHVDRVYIKRYFNSYQKRIRL